MQSCSEIRHSYSYAALSIKKVDFGAIYSIMTPVFTFPLLLLHHRQDIHFKHNITLKKLNKHLF